MSFSLSEQTEVQADVVVATLYVQREGERQAALSNEINQTMTWALQTAGQFDRIVARTREYRTDPVYQDNRITAWRAYQSLELRATDAGSLGEVLSQLQERLAVSGINYETSPSLQQEVEADLMDRLLGRVQTRAMGIAAAMGRGGYRIVRIDLQTGDNRPPIAYRASPMVSAEQITAPALTGGEQTLSVNASVEVQLDADARR